MIPLHLDLPIMYHPDIITQNQAKIVPLFKFRGKEYRFDLQEFSVAKVEEYKGSLDKFIDKDIWDRDKRVVYKERDGVRYEIPLELQRFMSNERILCQTDWKYWAARYYKVSDAETNKYVNYRFNRTATIFWDILKDQQILDKAIRELNPKARQVGRSTHWCGVMHHRMQFCSEIKGLLASYEKRATGKLVKMIMDSMDRQPWWLVPEVKLYRTGEYYEWMNHSRLDLAWGTQETMGTGTSPTIALLSEVAKYDYPELAIDAGLVPAMHESSASILILESTAERRNDYWHNTVKDVLREQQIGTTSFVCSFTPWCVRDDLYPTIGWIKGRAAAYERFVPSIETLQYARAMEATIHADYYFRKHMGSDWVMPKEQLFWYQLKKEEAERKNTLHIFLRETPSNLEEAFQVAGSSIYPIKVINTIEIIAQQKAPDVYKLRGDANNINPDLLPNEEERDKDKPIINISARYDSNLPSFDFELVPIKFQGWGRLDYQGHILVFEHPRKGFEYGFGADPAGGMGGDDAAIEGIRKGTVYYKDKQVCEFASNQVPVDNLWPYMLALGTYYSQFEGQQLISIETGKGGGGPLITDLRNRGWWNFFKYRNPEKVGEDLSRQAIGWLTTSRTRPEIVNRMYNFITNYHIEIGSVPFIGELKDLRERRTQSPGLGQIKYKIEGDSDNRYMALGIALVSIHQDEMMGYTMKSWEERQKREAEIVVHEAFDPAKYQLPFPSTQVMNRGKYVEPDWDDDVIIVGKAYEDEY